MRDQLKARPTTIAMDVQGRIEEKETVPADIPPPQAYCRGQSWPDDSPALFYPQTPQGVAEQMWYQAPSIARLMRDTPAGVRLSLIAETREGRQGELMYRYAQHQAYNFAVRTHGMGLDITAHAELLRRQEALEAYNYFTQRSVVVDRFAGRLATRLLEPGRTRANYLAVGIASSLPEFSQSIDQMLFRRLDDMGIAYRYIPTSRITPLDLGTAVDYRLVAGMMREGAGQLPSIAARDVPAHIWELNQAAHIATVVNGQLPYPGRSAAFCEMRRTLRWRFAQQPDLVPQVLSAYSSMQKMQGADYLRRAHLQSVLEDQLGRR
jgi:hypothetical protein